MSPRAPEAERIWIQHRGPCYIPGQHNPGETFFDDPAEGAVLHVVHSFKPNLVNEFVMACSVDGILLGPTAGNSSVAGSFPEIWRWIDEDAVRGERGP